MFAGHLSFTFLAYLFGQIIMKLGGGQAAQKEQEHSDTIGVLPQALCYYSLPPAVDRSLFMSLKEDIYHYRVYKFTTCLAVRVLSSALRRFSWGYGRWIRCTVSLSEPRGGEAREHWTGRLENNELTR